MTFQKGDSKPPGSGRKKGAMNKRNALVHDKVTTIVLSRIDRLLHYMDYMENAGRKDEATQMLLRLTRLIAPKPLPLDRYGDDDDNKMVPPCD